MVRPDNTSFGQEPDASWAIEGFDYPFVVVEVCDSQTIKELKRKVHRWIHYSNNNVKIVCFFEIEAVPTEARYRMLASVIKAEKHPNPSPEKPNGFKIVPRVAVHRQDISTECNTGAFTISAAEVYPDEWQESLTTDTHVTITLTSLYSRAFASVREKAAQVARDGEEVRPWNPDEEEVWTPSSSGSWEDDYQSPSEPDDLTDGNYES